MPIVLLRVDERLIHGQVVVGWGEEIHMTRIVVVDDEISESPWEQELYCLGVPPTMTAEFASVESARARFAEWQADPGRTVVLVRDAQSLERLAENGSLGDMGVNLGGLHSAPDRERVLPYLYLSPEDRESLRRVEQSGAKVSAQDVPGNRPVPLSELIKSS
jgi:mannose/fructose/N-acetylgalactosamine-specific phosphotransferase system component IIB